MWCAACSSCPTTFTALDARPRTAFRAGKLHWQVPALRAAINQDAPSDWQDALLVLSEAREQETSAPIEAYEKAAELSRLQERPARATQRAEGLLQEAKTSKLTPTARLYEAVVTSYGDAQSWEQTLFWLLEARGNAELTTQMLTSFFGACLAAKSWETAWQQALSLLVDAPRQRFVPTAEHFGLVMQSLKGGAPDAWLIATDLLAQMKRLGVQCSTLSYDGAACAFSTRWQGALDLLLQARQQGVQVPVHQTVQNLAEEARRGAEALRPFWDAAPSRRSLLARWSHALDLFFQQMQLGQPSSLEDYRAAIKACPRFYWYLSLHLLEQMAEESLGPDRLCFREAMRTCNRGLYSQEAAVSLFKEMGVQRLQPGVEEFNDLMLALITGNRWQEAFDLFADMQSGSSSPKPNLQSYCTVLYACADSNEANAWASAIGYWTDMRKDKITPDFDAYDMLLLVAERGERWDWSRQLVDTLFQLNAPSTVTMFNAALNAARRGKRWELAQSLLREMSEELLLPTIVSYSFAVESCEQADRFDVASQLLQLVDELDLK